MDKDVKKATSSDPDIRGTMRHILHGWEYMDLVEDISLFRQKQTFISKSSGGWTDLAPDMDGMILFGSGFEDIIRPVDNATAGLCHKWKRVPKDKDYLTTSVLMLNQLFKRAGSRLT